MLEMLGMSEAAGQQVVMWVVVLNMFLVFW